MSELANFQGWKARVKAAKEKQEKRNDPARKARRQALYEMQLAREAEAEKQRAEAALDPNRNPLVALQDLLKKLDPADYRHAMELFGSGRFNFGGLQNLAQSEKGRLELVAAKEAADERDRENARDAERLRAEARAKKAKSAEKPKAGKA